MQMASGKFHGLMTTATPLGLVPGLVELADERPEALLSEQGHGAAGVVLAEVDRLADVAVGVAPGLAVLLDDTPLSSSRRRASLGAAR